MLEITNCKSDLIANIEREYCFALVKIKEKANLNLHSKRFVSWASEVYSRKRSDEESAFFAKMSVVKRRVFSENRKSWRKKKESDVDDYQFGICQILTKA